jgi:hypothetical protein
MADDGVAGNPDRVINRELERLADKIPESGFHRINVRGGLSTKIHLKTNLNGNPLDFNLAGGEVSHATRFETALDLGPPIRPRMAITDKV